MSKMVEVGHWSGIPDMGWGSTYFIWFQTGVGFQSCGGIPDIGGVPDRDGGVPDRGSGLPDSDCEVPDRWWYARYR